MVGFPNSVCNRVAGCGVFGRPADLWKKIMVSFFGLEAAFRWVDNNFLIKEVDISVTVQDIVDISSEMG